MNAFFEKKNFKNQIKTLKWEKTSMFTNEGILHVIARFITHPSHVRITERHSKKVLIKSIFLIFHFLDFQEDGSAILININSAQQQTSELDNSSVQGEKE